MNLQKINISNFRCINELSLEIQPVNKGYAYSLIGINESGKSSILKAISLIEKSGVIHPIDFYDPDKPIKISLVYRVTLIERNELIKYLKEKHNISFPFPQLLTVNIETVYHTNGEIVANETPMFSRVIFSEYLVVNGLVVKQKEYSKLDIDNSNSVGNNIVDNVKNVKIDDEDLDEDIDDEDEEESDDEDDDESEENNKVVVLNLVNFFNEYLPDYFRKLAHNVVLWKSNPQYLISDEIDLTLFAENPQAVSIPLKNCFYLSNLTNIRTEILSLNTPVAIQDLEDRLNYNVTKHIKKVWPEHPVKIKFKINENKLSFLIEDEGVRFKNKTTSQRSDGFRQLISFLLTKSAEHSTDELKNSVLLLDEPEVHLHPSAQINLKNELLKLSLTNNNIVFYATHSNYMIDKENIERCYRVEKIGNLNTEIKRIKAHSASYSEVNYEVFDIPTTDYHNELYGYIMENHKTRLDKVPKDMKWFNTKSEKSEDVTLPTFIRHSIHHPENKTNKKFTESDLKKSIDILRKLAHNDIGI